MLTEAAAEPHRVSAGASLELTVRLELPRLAPEGDAIEDGMNTPQLTWNPAAPCRRQ